MRGAWSVQLLAPGDALLAERLWANGRRCFLPPPVLQHGAVDGIRKQRVRLALFKSGDDQPWWQADGARDSLAAQDLSRGLALRVRETCLMGRTRIDIE